jgi:hypothetical protein
LHQLQAGDRPLNTRAEAGAPAQRLADLNQHPLVLGTVHGQVRDGHAQRLGLPGGVVVVHAAAEVLEPRRWQVRRAAEQLAGFRGHGVDDAVLVVLLQHVAQRGREIKRQVAVAAVNLRCQVERRVEQRVVVAHRHEALRRVMDGAGARRPYHHEAAEQIALQLTTKATGLKHRPAPPQRSQGRG